MQFSYEKAVPFECPNCRIKITAIRDRNGKMRVKCPHCGTVTVSQVMSRRHVHADIYAPEGQSIM